MLKQKSYTVDQAKRALESYCAYQERCHQDVCKKLRSMNMIPDAIDLVVVHLIDNDFLNETRFARSYTRGKFRVKKWGRKRIELELKKRDISAYNIKEAFKEISDADYLQTFHELAEKKWHSINESNLYKKKKKLANYLLYRGWESHLVYDKINGLSQ
ncbi:regulatory protein RecX [Hanstruepera marina]|uniref:regulatory protein RecX n=1 Tax=Hanstruepera marina TaxID=2873265 RepID=UPI001CA65BC0|nr:regulatory protein RecX [Hanstruepera marina]